MNGWTTHKMEIYSIDCRMVKWIPIGISWKHSARNAIWHRGDWSRCAVNRMEEQRNPWLAVITEVWGNSQLLLCNWNARRKCRNLNSILANYFATTFNGNNFRFHAETTFQTFFFKTPLIFRFYEAAESTDSVSINRVNHLSQRSNHRLFLALLKRLTKDRSKERERNRVQNKCNACQPNRCSKQLFSASEQRVAIWTEARSTKLEQWPDSIE